MNDQITKNFKRSEFSCNGDHCCMHSAPISMSLVEPLQVLRDIVAKEHGDDASIIVTSGFRCRKHNMLIGGAPDSYHTLGLASDVFSHECTVEALHIYACKIPAFKNGGIGIYDTFLHLDVREFRARWDKRTNK